MWRSLAWHAVVLGGASFLAGCGSDTTGPSNPNTPSIPSVSAATALVSVAPQGGATNVSPTGVMTMQFNGAMAAGMGQLVDLHLGDISGPTVPITCSWSADRTTLTCTPNAQLQSQTQYTLHMGGGMTGSTGIVVSENAGMNMGGQPVIAGGMMGTMHAGQPMSMMGPGWQGQSGTYGMAFVFQTG